MKYDEFLNRFGASVRTKNILQPGEEVGPKHRTNRRPHVLPPHSEIERDLIRLDPWEAEYLFRLAERARQGIVETGRLRGGSTFVLACANGAVPIWSIDIAPADDDALRSRFAATGVGERVELLVGDSGRGRFEQIGAFDFLFVDGDHSYEGCSNDLRAWFSQLTPGGHVLVHDSYPGQPVMDAVADFCREHDVDVVVPAWRTSDHWWHHAGSMAHFVKRG